LISELVSRPLPRHCRFSASRSCTWSRCRSRRPVGQGSLRDRECTPGSTTSRWPTWWCHPHDDRAAGRHHPRVLVEPAGRDRRRGRDHAAAHRVLHHHPASPTTTPVVLMNNLGPDYRRVATPGIPGFAALMSVLTRQLLAKFPAEELGATATSSSPTTPGSRLVTCLTSRIVTPIFHRGTLVGFTGHRRPRARHRRDSGPRRHRPDVRGPTDSRPSPAARRKAQRGAHRAAAEQRAALRTGLGRLEARWPRTTSAGAARSSSSTTPARTTSRPCSAASTPPRTGPCGGPIRAIPARGLPIGDRRGRRRRADHRIECAVTVRGDEIVIDYAGNLAAGAVPDELHAQLHDRVLDLPAQKSCSTRFTRTNYGSTSRSR